MAVDVGSTALRELLMVLALAAVGVVLALLAVFTPWYGAASDAEGVNVVELHSPPVPTGAVSDR